MDRFGNVLTPENAIKPPAAARTLMPQSESQIVTASEKVGDEPIAMWKRVCFAIAAGVFFVLGAIGLLLPGLPTTPFLLLTSFFLVRSVPSLNDGLLRSRLFGPILTDWQKHRGVRRDIKLKAIAVVFLAVSATLWFSSLPPWAGLGVVLMASIGIAVIVRLPTLRS